MTAILLLTLLAVLAFCALVRRSDRRAQGADRFDWTFASHHNGRYLHVLPGGRDVHTEDHLGQCRCRPWTEKLRRPDGSWTEVHYHRRPRRLAA